MLSNALKIRVTNQTITTISIVIPHFATPERVHSGFFHLLEHLLLKATPNKKTSLARYFESIGSSYQAYTDHFCMALEFKLISKYLTPSLIFIEKFFNQDLSVSQHHFIREKNIIQTEIWQRQNQFNTYLMDRFICQGFQNGLYTKTAYGDPQSIAAIKRTAVNRFFSTLNRSQVAIVIHEGSDVRIIPSDLQETCDRWMKIENPRWHAFSHNLNPGKSTTYLWGNYIPLPDQATYLSLRLLQIYLQEQSFSPLKQQLKEKDNLAYQVEMQTEFLPHGALFYGCLVSKTLTPQSLSERLPKINQVIFRSLTHQRLHHIFRTLKQTSISAIHQDWFGVRYAKNNLFPYASPHDNHLQIPDLKQLKRDWQGFLQTDSLGILSY